MLRLRENLLTYLHQLLDTNLPFLALRRAGKNEVIVLSQVDNKLHKQPHDKMAYGVFSKFLSANSHVFIHGEVVNSFRYGAKPFKPGVANMTLSENEQRTHHALVQDAIKTLQTTGLEKVVLSRKQTVQTPFAHHELYGRLLDAYFTANCYFFYHPKVGTWLGATPEVLLDVQNDDITTMSLAGTALFKENENHDWGAKELEEQQFVTSQILTSLKQVGATGITTQPLETVRAGAVQHLRTIINATMPYNKHAAMVAALHPTPAICGLPTQQALDFIIKNEGYDRSFYTGYLGIVEPSVQKATYYVNLRCMQLQHHEATIYVGGGITAQSNAQAEVEETIHKSQTMGVLLNL